MVLGVERVEPHIERTQRDRVQRQPGHVLGDVDLHVWPEALPADHHLLGDVEHLAKVVLHRHRPERRHQQPVRLPPVRLLVVRGEQPVTTEVAHLIDRVMDLLRPQRTGAHLRHQRVFRGEDLPRAQHIKGEHAAVLGVIVLSELD